MYLFPSLVLGKGPTKSRPIRSNSLSTVIDFKRPDGLEDDGLTSSLTFLTRQYMVRELLSHVGSNEAFG